jgi:hypothetical protein
MTNTRIPEDNPNHDKFIEQAELPYKEIGETWGTDVYRLNGDRGIAVYRKFKLDGNLPGTKVEAEKFYGVETELLGDVEQTTMLVRPKGGNSVFEYHDGAERPDEVRNLGEFGHVRNVRIKDMLTPDDR